MPWDLISDAAFNPAAAQPSFGTPMDSGMPYQQYDQDYARSFGSVPNVVHAYTYDGGANFAVQRHTGDPNYTQWAVFKLNPNGTVSQTSQWSAPDKRDAPGKTAAQGLAFMAAALGGLGAMGFMSGGALTGAAGAMDALTFGAGGAAGGTSGGAIGGGGSGIAGLSAGEAGMVAPMAGDALTASEAMAALTPAEIAGGMSGVGGTASAAEAAALGAGGASATGWGGLAGGIGSQLIPAGASLLGGVLQSNAQKDAAETIAGANAQAIAEQQRQYDLTRGDFAPYREAGKWALGQLTGDSGINSPFNFTGQDAMQEPGYAFGLQQGQQALDRKFAAGGGRISGAALKQATQFGNDYATQRYGQAYARKYGERNDRLNRLAALAGVAQSGTSSGATIGASSSNKISDLVSDTGQGAAAAQLAAGNTWSNVTNQLAALYDRNRNTQPVQPNGFNYYTGG